VDGPDRRQPLLANFAAGELPRGLRGDLQSLCESDGVAGDACPKGGGKHSPGRARRGGERRFDILPLVISTAGGPPGVFGLPSDVVLEVPLSHPRFGWFAELGLRWHAVPVITDMCLEIGGICYPAAPFNGWYMGTEIGARNLADCDRYNQLPEIAARMGLDLNSDRSLWRDQAMVELNVAVLHSFDAAGVTITDHHTESRRFLTHLAREERARRICPADWSWIVPPISGSATEVFHRYYDEADLRPSYVRHDRDLPGLHPGPE